MYLSENILLGLFIIAIIVTHIISSSIQDPINKSKNGKPYIKSKQGQKDFVNYHLMYAIEMLGMAIVIFVYTGISFF